MQFRIEAKIEVGVTVIEIAGVFCGQALTELSRLCRTTLGPLCLDLANLQSVEEEGVRLLKELEASGVVLRGVSPYLRLLLA